MEIMVPSNTDFIFDSAQSTPFVSAPSSPRPFGAGDPFDCYYHHYMTSAPTSPSRVAARAHNPDDFAFDFGGGRPEGTGDLTAADELFEEGKIRPLKPPPPPPQRARDEKGGGNAASSPRSPESPFAAAATRERGRERSSASSYSAVPSASSSRSRKGSRSLSPMRRSRGAATAGVAPTTIGAECLKSNSGGGGGGKKWRLKDLLLFRSASEGRVTGNKSKDPLGKYTIVSSSSSSLFSKKGGEDSRNSSFRSTESSGSSTRRSPHEMHYKSNRAAAEEMKKKTALPFNRHGFFGCLSFNPAVNGVAKSFHDSCSSFDRRR